MDADHGFIYSHHPSSGHSILLDALMKKPDRVALISEMSKYFENEVLTQGTTY